MKDFLVERLGDCLYESPLRLTSRTGRGDAHFVPEDARTALDVECTEGDAAPRRLLEKAGPRERLFFDPARTRAAVVTCGGLCPGINNVVRAIVLELHHRYRVPSILGFRYGYEGMDPGSHIDPVELGPDQVRNIHKSGGSVLGVSRGRRDVGALVDNLIARRIDVLFTIGGDGTLSGASEICAQISRRKATMSVVGIPKTIDNDIPFLDKTLGFDTAVEAARGAIDAAHVEATGAQNGIGLVKLMGRDSGFIAAAATLASDDVNFCLVPEVPFRLRGDDGLLASIERRLKARSHAVVVVAEGCGASLAGPGAERDASGNVRYASPSADVGSHLRDVIVDHFRERQIGITLKYIDPSYLIRSVPANAADSILCDELGRNAVHAAMAGRTCAMVGRIHGVFAHVPFALVTKTHKRIDPAGPEWQSVLEATGQPSFS